jgi:peptide/nickel transport system ATP-binding protein
MLDAITQAESWRLLVRVVQERKLGLLAIIYDVALLERVSSGIVSLTD